MPVERVSTRPLRDGFREEITFSYLVTITVDCLLLLGETEAAAALVADYMTPELTVNGWPLHLSRAELDVLAGEPAAASLAVEKVETLDFSDEEIWIWLAEIGAAADLWSGHAESAWDRIDRVWARVRRSPLASRAGRMLSLAAWAAADLADADPALDRQGLARQLKQWAEEAECFAGHPALVLGTAFGATFDAELARLERSGEESAWRAAKDTWASYDVPHHAAYAGWRLAVLLLDRGRRNDGQSELVAAYAAAQHHQPLRREIEALARLARLPLGDVQQMPDSPPQQPRRRTAAAASRRVSWMSSGCLGPAPVTTRSHIGSTSARKRQASMSPASIASSASMDAFRRPWSPSGWGYSPPTATTARHLWRDVARSRQVTSRPAAAQRLRDLARLRRVRDRIDREYAQPLDVEALARGAHMSAGHLSREFRLAYGESPYGYLMTRRIERAMALLRRGDLSVTEVCFAVGCSSLGTFSTRFTELVGVPPSVYRREAARATAGMPPCVAKQVTRPVRNREAPVAEPQLA